MAESACRCPGCDNEYFKSGRRACPINTKRRRKRSAHILNVFSANRVTELLRAFAGMVVQEILVNGFASAESFLHAVPILN